MGVGRIQAKNMPSLIEKMPKAAKKFTIGYNTMAIQDVDGAIYHNGYNYEKKRPAVQNLPNPESIKVIACGNDHFVHYSFQKDLYTVG